MPTPILSVKNLHVRYGSKQAVAGVSFSIERGQIFGLLGPNGAGKTSTLSVIEGLLAPQEGDVLVDGISIERDTLAAKAKLGVQLQSTSFQAELTIFEIIRLFTSLYGVEFSRERITKQLEDIGLSDEASRRFKQLSGGQQQRLSLLIATIHDPELVLLDEPTAGLDPQSRRQLWGRIERIRKEGRSILLTTHSMEEAQSVCDHIAIIDHGTIVASGTPEGLIKQHKDDPEVKRASRGAVTLEDVFIGLTGSEIR